MAFTAGHGLERHCSFKRMNKSLHSVGFTVDTQLKSFQFISESALFLFYSSWSKVHLGSSCTENISTFDKKNSPSFYVSSPPSLWIWFIRFFFSSSSLCNVSLQLNPGDTAARLPRLPITTTSHRLCIDTVIVQPDFLSITHTHTHTHTHIFTHKSIYSHSCTYMYSWNACIDGKLIKLNRTCTSNKTPLVLSWNDSVCVRPHRETDRIQTIHTGVKQTLGGTADPSPNTSDTVPRMAVLRGGVPWLSQLLSRSTASPAALRSLHPIYDSQYLQPARGDAPRRQKQPFHCTCCLAN